MTTTKGTMETITKGIEKESDERICEDMENLTTDMAAYLAELAAGRFLQTAGETSGAELRLMLGFIRAAGQLDDSGMLQTDLLRSYFCHLDMNYASEELELMDLLRDYDDEVYRVFIDVFLANEKILWLSGNEKRCDKPALFS